MRSRIPSAVHASLRQGLTLVEVMAAVVVLGVSATGLAAMTFYVGQRSYFSAGASSRAASLIEHADRLASLPFDSLPGRVGCTTIADTTAETMIVGSKPHSYSIISCADVKAPSPKNAPWPMDTCPLNPAISSCPIW